MCLMGIRPRSVTRLGPWRTRRIGTRSEWVALVCHWNVLSCGYCVTFGTGHGNCTKNMIFWVFLVFFLLGIYGQQMATLQEESLCTFPGHYRTPDWYVHILDKSSFCVRKYLFPVHNAWIWAQFDHIGGPLCFRSSVHRALNNTETVLFGVCIALLMCIHTEVEYCMT